MQLAGVHLAEVDEELGFQLGVARGEPLEVREQDVIGRGAEGERRERHEESFPG